MNSILPESAESLSPWKTRNFYFYEITNTNGEFFIQLYLYCKGITEEMRVAFSHLLKVLRKGELKNGYMLIFRSNPILNANDDNEKIVREQLDGMFNELRAFEIDLLERWKEQ